MDPDSFTTKVHDCQAGISQRRRLHFCHGKGAGTAATGASGQRPVAGDRVPGAVPVNVRVFPDGVPDCSVIPNVPFTWAAEISRQRKRAGIRLPHDEAGRVGRELKVQDANRTVVVHWSDVAKARAVEWPFSIRVAFHDPVRLDGFVLFEPHPFKTRPTSTNNAVPSPKGRGDRLDFGNRVASAPREGSVLI